MAFSHRPAFTVVEALVATAIIGVAGASLAAVLGGTATLRARGEADGRAAQLVRERIGALATRSCAAPDTAGAAPPERWHARRTGAGWEFSDSVDDVRSSRPIVVAGAVACAR